MIVKICKEGETAVRAALHELIDERYVYLEKLPPNYSKSGRFEYVYHIYEIPYENIPDGLECPELFLKKQSETNQNADVPNTGQTQYFGHQPNCFQTEFLISQMMIAHDREVSVLMHSDNR